MTKQQAVEWLRGGTEGISRWNNWRKSTEPFSDGRLEIDLIDVDLRGAQLQGADLRQATLKGTNLAGADLSGAMMNWCVLNSSTLDDANLEFANLNRASLSEVQLVGTNLIGASLSMANLTNVDLSRSHLRLINLIGTNLTAVELSESRLDEAKLGGTVFNSIDLAELCRAKDLVHNLPSTVDHGSLVLSAHEPKLKSFLRAAGMPEIFIEYMVSSAQALTASERKALLQSTFISYGGPDEAFALKLNQALIDQGVTTFVFKKDAEPGMRLSRVMHEGVRKFDRVILICSKHSLDRPGVLNEITQTLSREAADGGEDYLLPVRLDDYVLKDWAPKNPQLSLEVRDRVVADFTDPSRFADEVGRLVRALMRRHE